MDIGGMFIESMSPHAASRKGGESKQWPRQHEVALSDDLFLGPVQTEASILFAFQVDDTINHDTQRRNTQLYSISVRCHRPRHYPTVMPNCANLIAYA